MPIWKITGLSPNISNFMVDLISRFPSLSSNTPLTSGKTQKKRPWIIIFLRKFLNLNNSAMTTKNSSVTIKIIQNISLKSITPTTTRKFNSWTKPSVKHPKQIAWRHLISLKDCLGATRYYRAFITLLKGC